MKTNIFNVREKKENKIIIEEEKTKNPFLLFFRRHKKAILLFLGLLILSLLLASFGIAMAVIQPSTDFDISYLDGSSDEIKTNTDPAIKDEDVAEELLGAIARNEGVVLLTDTFIDKNNNVIYYFSDKTAIMITSDGKIYRISPVNNKYGVDKDGNINTKAKKTLVKSTTTTLKDGTVITNYTDGTALVYHNNVTLFVRDSNNIKLNGGVTFNNILPSGVSIFTSKTKKGDSILTTFTDKAKQIEINNKKYLINPNAKVTESIDRIDYDKNNTFDVKKEQKLSDGNTITYFNNGAAIITDEEGKQTYVKKSGDILIKDDKIFEIITNKYGYSVWSKVTIDGIEVTYYDNGAAIIKDKDGTKKYIENSDDILYDENGKIASIGTSYKQIAVKTTTDGYEDVNFSNGKSQVIKKDGTSFIIDTNKLKFDTEGNITSNRDYDDNTNKDKPKPKPERQEDPLEGMYVSEAEHEYNATKSLEISKFIIKNTNNKTKKFRIVIEEVPNYRKYNIERLKPEYVKFQATIGDDYVPASPLTTELWKNENSRTTYVIYDGSISAKASLDVAVTMYVDYEPLDNTYQNTAFIGTIKVYVNE